MKVKINDLPTMAIHFFEKPNKILFSDSEHRTVIIAETEETFDQDFCIDSESFNLMKKLITNRKISFENNQVVIESDEGKYLCARLNKTKPEIEEINNSNCVYRNTYDIQELRDSRKSVSTQKIRPMLCGVIFNSSGELFGTDAVRIYYSRLKENEKQLTGWSIPTNFIDMLTDEKIEILFGERSVITHSSLGYDIQSVIYQGNIPDLKSIINTSTPIKFEFNKTDQINLFSSDSVLLTNENNMLNIKFLNETNEFNLHYPLLNSCENFTLRVKADFFVEALNVFKDDKITIETNQRFIKINNKIIIGCQSHKVNK